MTPLELEKVGLLILHARHAGRLREMARRHPVASPALLEAARWHSERVALLASGMGSGGDVGETPPPSAEPGSRRTRPSGGSAQT